ncbi:MAG: DUF2147 domain-containing protein [Janthinobacterium lividum]
MKLLRLLGGALLLPVLSFHAQTAGPAAAAAQTTGVQGDWREASGSVIRIAPCGDALCAKLVLVSAAAPVSVDGMNPDSSLRTRPLCGLLIGEGFHATDPNKADEGKLYDPKTGKTYKGAMTSEGDTLLLRGYIGIAAFGRTAKWDRVKEPVEACKTDTAAASAKPTATVEPAPAATKQ